MSPATERMLSLASKSNTQKKHERFALEYLIDYDQVRAYKLVYDEDGDMEEHTARAAASRLLRSVAVEIIIDREECKFLAEKRLEKEQLVEKLQRVYHKAMQAKDYSSANSALDKLAKHFGFYQEHNKQKRYGPDEIVAIKQKLEAYGILADSQPVNKPSLIEIETTEVPEPQEME